MARIKGVLPRRGHGRAWVLAGVAITALACGGNPGDPGNARLEALQSDPALTLTPPGAELVGESHRQAQSVPFTDTYMGPTASREFRLSGSFSEAVDFYADKLPELGWRFSHTYCPSWGECSPEITHDTSVHYTKEFGSWEGDLMLVMDDPPGSQELAVITTAPAVVE